MRRIERLRAITHQLRDRSPHTVSAADLAERFAVSPRTIERDVRSLKDAGIPIHGAAGPGGGYCILPDHGVPPVQLTAQEAAATVAALNLLERSPLASHARTALTKVRAALPAAVAAAASGGARTVASPRAQATAAWMDAMRARRLVQITTSGGEGPRLVEPYTTLQGGDWWYLVGWCRDRQAVRAYRTDRIAELGVTSTQFEPVHSRAVTEHLARWTRDPGSVRRPQASDDGSRANASPSRPRR